MKRNVGLALLTSASALGLAWTANAQTVSGNELLEVVVTGSRVITNGNDSPTPVTVVTVEEMQATRPTTVFEGLLDMPVFAGSRGAVTNPGVAGGTNNNISALSLRGLGQERTLVLYDGHRVPPSQGNGYVDANMIPQMLLQRVDIVTGGVSAVYGSDAVAGVVNFITDRKFEGVKFNAQTGVSEFGDDHSYELGLAFGTNLFGGRGHFMGSIQRHYDQGILYRTDRPLGIPRWTLQGDGTAALPHFLAANATLANVTFGGKIVGSASNPLNNQQFISNGLLGPFVNGSTEGVIGNVQLGGDGGYFTSASLKARLDFDQLYGRFDFDVTDNLHYYLTAAGTQEHSFNYFTDNQLVNVTLSTSNAFLSPSYQQQMISAGLTTFRFGKMWQRGDLVPAQDSDNDISQWFVNTGLEGTLGDYNWDASYTHSIAKLKSVQNGNFDLGRLYAALDAVLNSSGQVVCRVTVTNPTLYPGCVPLNVFGPSSETQSAVGYIVRPGQYDSQNNMDDLTASITGAPFSTWAGPVNMALSGEWRYLTYQLDSNSLPSDVDPLDCTGIRFNCSAGRTPRWTTAVANRPEVSQTVTEAALEAEVPLLTERSFAQSLSVNMAGRYARYSQTGNPIITDPKKTTTFNARTGKFGVVWDINDAVTVRATRSRDFRAPNLNDLYAPGAVSVAANYTDNLTGVTPVALLQTGGNPNLIPETAYTTTLGLVLRPTPQFSLAMDGYDITIKNAITRASGYSTPSQRACYQSGGSSFYCTLQERPFGLDNTTAANAVTRWYQVPLNSVVKKTWGADIEANYRTDVFEHPFSLRGLVAYQPHVIVEEEGAATSDFAGVDFSNSNQGGAVWRVTLQARYSPIENFTVNWSTRWRSRLHHNSEDDDIVGRGDSNVIPAASFSNLSLTYRIESELRGQADVYLNIQNVFDKMPFPSASPGPQTQPGKFGGYVPGDDPVGRYYSLGLRWRM